ncbi:hypothetical protein AOLI_G00015230 [Acnodon oligacanthus]
MVFYDVKELILLVMMVMMERIHGMSGTDSVSPPPPLSSRMTIDASTQTLENFNIASQEGPSSFSSSHPLNDNPALNPDPVVLKETRRGFRCHFHIKAPVISCGFRKSRKVYPAGLLSADHPPSSSTGNHQESSHGETEKKVCERLSRIFSSIGKALPNPLSCMTPPC